MLIKLNEITSDEALTFELENDEVISLTCGDCGEEFEVEDDECTACGSEDMIVETAHENLVCDICNENIDMWDAVAKGTHNHKGITICTKCYYEVIGDSTSANTIL